MLNLMAIRSMMTIYQPHVTTSGGCCPSSCKMLRVYVMVRVAVAISTAVSICLLLSMLLCMVTCIQTDSHSRVARNIVGKAKCSWRWLLAKIAITRSSKTMGSLGSVVRAGTAWVSHQGRHKGVVSGGSASISGGGEDLLVLLSGSEFLFDPTLNFVVDQLVRKTTTERHGGFVDLNRRGRVLNKCIFRFA